MRAAFLIVLVAALAGVASGCGALATAHNATSDPTKIVRLDLSRIRGALPGWRAAPVSKTAARRRCIDLQGGRPLARAERVYSYPASRPSAQLDVAVEYRTPTHSRLRVATYNTAGGGLRCPRTALISYNRRWARSHLPRGRRAVYVRTTTRLPSWRTAELPAHANGYQVTITIPGLNQPGFNSLHGLLFIYQSESDPHIVYTVILGLHEANLSAEAQITHRVIHATK